MRCDVVERNIIVFKRRGKGDRKLLDRRVLTKSEESWQFQNQGGKRQQRARLRRGLRWDFSLLISQKTLRCDKFQVYQISNKLIRSFQILQKQEFTEFIHFNWVSGMAGYPWHCGCRVEKQFPKHFDALLVYACQHHLSPQAMVNEYL